MAGCGRACSNLAGRKLLVQNEEELREHLSPVCEGRPAEVWLEDSESGTLLLLSHGREAFLMHLYVGEGWTTRAAEAEETAGGFILSNGQVDEFPSSWVVPLQQAMDALLHFSLHGERAPGLNWHDDSSP